MSRDLVQRAASAIVDGIVDGRFAEGAALPGEAELASLLGVSRLTMREAVKILRERGVLDVVHGRGTYVAPRSSWTDLATLIDVTRRSSSAKEVGLRLIELRRMVEVGSAGLAARNRTAHDIAVMEETVETMARAGESDDVECVVEADLAFHMAVMEASGNPFIAGIMTPLHEAMRDARMVTSSLRDVRERALMHHREILRAVASGDEEAAKDAMRSHMTQTRLDFTAASSN